MSLLTAVLLWLVAGLLVWLDRTALRRGRREAAVYLIALFCCCLLTVMLVMFPEAQGPTLWADQLFKPISRFLSP